MQSPKLSAPGLLNLPARNALAAAALVWLACAAYSLAPWNAVQMREWHSIAGIAFTGREFLWAAAGAYSLAVAAWFCADREPRPGKSLLVFALLAGWLKSPATARSAGLDPPARLAVLTTLLKGFFGPLMVMSLMLFCVGALQNGNALWAAIDAGWGPAAIFNRFGFWLLMQLILFVDVAIFTVGYLVESRRLGNEIRSVDPTWLGWLAALACYPPFNAYTSLILGSQHSDYPQFSNPTVHLVLNGLMLALMATYTSASVALGLKGSNLTHRGIVARGPYAVVRHPAYVCKNAAWWIGAAPLVSAAFARGMLDGLAALASVIGWTALYVLRALTEEDHLRRVDGEYAAYAARVKFRFVPGLV